MRGSVRERKLDILWNVHMFREFLLQGFTSEMQTMRSSLNSFCNSEEGFFTAFSNEIGALCVTITGFVYFNPLSRQVDRNSSWFHLFNPTRNGCRVISSGTILWHPKCINRGKRAYLILCTNWIYYWFVW